MVSYLHPEDHKADKDFTRKLDFRDIGLPIKVRDINKIEKMNCISIAVLVMKVRKNIQFMYQEMFSKDMFIY